MFAVSSDRLFGQFHLEKPEVHKGRLYIKSMRYEVGLMNSLSASCKMPCTQVVTDVTVT